MGIPGIIWLEVVVTNKAPELIAKYYLDAVKQMNETPKIIKAGDGNEHLVIEPLHDYFRELTVFEHKLIRASKTA